MTSIADNLNHLLPELPLQVRLVFGRVAQFHRGELNVHLPDGRMVWLSGREPGPSATIKLANYRFGWSLLFGGDTGMAESYIRGDWSTPDLAQLLYLFCLNEQLLQDALAGSRVLQLVRKFGHRRRRNTKARARRNIYAHYDLGNEFFSAWLDPSMTYSSGMFAPGMTDLVEAQQHKYQQLASAIQLQPGERLLEIGCGWGGFAEFAARSCGAKVVALTISKEQHDFARKRIQEAGLADSVDIRLQDYRDERGQYDRIASIEMIEAVGEQFWPKYFAQLHDRLAPGGLAGIQAITIRDDLFDGYRQRVDFVQQHIFPGGMLPSPAALRALGRRFDIPLISERVFGEDYALTIASWRKTFHAEWPRIRSLGFDERFRRLWEYYLCYCEAGFRSANVRVRQLVFARTG
jgi:cyclopropane-fatty-acyl-phospholipid synthase